MIVTVTLNPAVDKTGELERLTPGSVNRLTSIRQDPGGKGINVSKSLKVLGSDSIAMGLLGGSSGAWIVQALSALHISCDFVTTQAPTRTNLKLIDSVSGETTDINEPGQHCGAPELLEITHKLSGILKVDDIAVFSGSLPPGVPSSIYADWAVLCKEAGAKAFVDADGESLQLAVDKIPYAIKPNEHELSRLCGKHLCSVEELCTEGMRLVEKGIRLVTVSMGSRGALFLSENARYYCPGIRVQEKSTVGAGDAMMAAIAFGEHNSLPLKETAVLAVALSAASVMQSGTQGADPAVVKELQTKVVLESL